MSQSGSQGSRKIIHIDMDAFYASVEMHDNPALKGKPVVVGGSPEKRGVVAAASYEARKFGVRSAMSSSQAKRLCPQAVFLHPRFERYVEVSRQIREIFFSVTELVEPLALDEAFLDVTINKLNEPLAKKVAQHIKTRIREVTGLTASAGVAPNKFLAKLATDMRKPDGLVVIPPEKIEKTVEALSVEKLWGVGPATAKLLAEKNIFTTADIRLRPREKMIELLGKFGPFLHDLAHGIDDRPVETEREPKSRGTETTFEKNIIDRETLLQTLHDQCSIVAKELSDMERPARTVTVKLRYSDFTTITRSVTLFAPTDSAEVLETAASRLLLEHTEAGRRPVRLLGVSVSGILSPEEPLQLWFDLPGM